MRVLLIDPWAQQKGLNIGLAYLAGSLKGKHDVTILDLNNNEEDIDGRLTAELDKKPDLVGISIKLMTLKEAQRVIQLAKKYHPDAYYCAGGPQVTNSYTEIFADIPELDFLIVGDGEHTFLEVCTLLEQKKPLHPMDGLFLKTDTQTKPIFIQDLNSIRFPDFEGFYKSDYYPLLTSRGCPYGCTYCSVGNVSGKRWRMRDFQKVIEELKLMKERYGITEFQIQDDNLTLHLPKVKEFCRLLIGEKLNLKWCCPNGIRADKTDMELFRLMKKAGCYLIMFGVESGNEEVFTTMNKGEKLHHIARSVKLARKAGIKCGGFFIIGLPKSTFEREIESIQFAKKIGLDFAHWNMLSPYPHTPLWDWVQQHGRMLKDYKQGKHFGMVPGCVFDTEDFPEAERQKAYILAGLRNWRVDMFWDEDGKNYLKLFTQFPYFVWKYDRSRIPEYLYEFLFHKSRFYSRIVLKKVMSLGRKKEITIRNEGLWFNPSTSLLRE